MIKTQTVTISINAKQTEALLKQSARDKDGYASLYFPIRFLEAFSSKPTVVLGVTGFNGGDTSYSFKINPHLVTETGFEIKFESHDFDSIHWIQVTWLALDGTAE